GDRVLVPAAGLTFGLVERRADRFQVGQRQLGVDRVDVAQRVDAVFDVGDVRILERPDDVKDRVHLPDMGQELVPEPLAGARPPNDARDVNDPQGGWNDLLGLDELIDRVQAGVGDGDDADVGLDGGEGVVRGEGAGGGEGVEEGALADVGQADDSDFQGHR